MVIILYTQTKAFYSYIPSHYIPDANPDWELFHLSAPLSLFLNKGILLGDAFNREICFSITSSVMLATVSLPANTDELPAA